MSRIALDANASGTGVFTIASPNSNTDYTINLPEISGGEFVATDASGNVTIGSTDAGNAGTLNLSVGLAGTTAGGIQLWSPTNGSHFVQFGDSTGGDGPYRGLVGYNHTNDALIMYTAGTESARIDSSGNVGIGLTPSAWSTGKAVELGFQGNALWGNAADEVIVSQNAYYNSGWKYATNRVATHYSQYNGAHRWFTAPSGTANGALTWSESMRIDASGRVGIGTTTLVNPLTVNLTANANSKTSGSAFDGGAIRLTASAGLSGTNSEMAILAGAEDSLSAGIGFARENGGNWGTQIRFYNHSTSITTTDELTERMRIDASGNLLWANTGGVSSSQSGIVFSNTTHSYIQISGGSDTNFRYRMEFINGNGQVGTITTNGSSTSYNTSSDYRLKENLVGLDNGIDRLKQIPVYRFNFIADPNTTVDGFIAHEVQDVVPEAISGSKDAVDAEGNPEYQGIDQSKLVPLLTAALQEAITKIEDLESRLSAVEAN